MRKIVYTRADGGISIVHPVINTHPVREEITEAEAEARAWAKLPGGAIAPRFVEEGEVPTDRTFRSAWTADLSVDMEKARDIHRDRLRAERAPLLASLDAEYMRADEQGNAAEKQRVAARKQALRDATDAPAIEAAETPDDLKNVRL